MILQIFFTCIYLFIYICVYVKFVHETYTVNVFFCFHLFKGVLFLLFLSVMYMFCGLMSKKIWKLITPGCMSYLFCNVFIPNCSILLSTYSPYSLQFLYLTYDMF